MIWLCILSKGFNIDSFYMVEHISNKLILPGGAYKNIIPTVPGLIEAEEFDDGGKGVAYYDTTSGNKGKVR